MMPKSTSKFFTKLLLLSVYKGRLAFLTLVAYTFNMPKGCKSTGSLINSGDLTPMNLQAADIHTAAVLKNPRVENSPANHKCYKRTA